MSASDCLAQYLQKTGVTSTNTVRISNLPSSMPTVSSHLAASGSDEKLPAGPMIVPRPGPTLHTAVAAPLRAVIQSSPISARPKAMAAIVMVKKNEKVSSERTISSSMGWPLYFFSWPILVHPIMATHEL